MALIRTREDILRAYKVYKCMDIFKQKTNMQDANMLTLIATFVELYNGVSVQELEAILPVSKSCIRELVKKGIYTYGIFNFDSNLVLGRNSVIGKICKGVLTLTDQLSKAIADSTKTLRVPDVRLKAFAIMLSNSSSHVVLMQDNIENLGSKDVLRHLHALFTSFVNKNLYSECNYVKNLSRLGYMRAVNGDVELNKSAVFYNKEPQFELRRV